MFTLCLPPWVTWERSGWDECGDGLGLRRWISQRGWDDARDLLSAEALAIALAADDEGVRVMGEAVEGGAGCHRPAHPHYILLAKQTL